MRSQACVTCRQKCRKCDRSRPSCKRCMTSGIDCGGYPENFRFCGLASRGKWRNCSAPVDNDPQPAAKGNNSIVRKNEKIKAKVAGDRQRNAEPHDVPPDSEDIGDLLPGHILFSHDNSSNQDADTQSPSYTTASDPSLEIEKILLLGETELLLDHYDRIICPHQIAHLSNLGMDNPYRLYVLPLAYEQAGVLYATLSFSACHLGNLNNDKHFSESVALDYRIKAMAALGKMIQRGSSGEFDDNERDGIFATIQLLLLHDICESGISQHGAHIFGAMSMCSQIISNTPFIGNQERMLFFLGNLLWLDIVRAFARPERLCFMRDLREKILRLVNANFEAVNGCPRELVLIMGNLLEAAQAHTTNALGVKNYLNTLQNHLNELYSWDSSKFVYPDSDPAWPAVAEAFRHACILRTLRLLDITEPAEEGHIQRSVFAILDAVGIIPEGNGLIELMVLPLFLAGADCILPHSRHYILYRLAEIKSRSEMSNIASKNLLEKVWYVRSQQSQSAKSNVPWMIFTNDSGCVDQHDYLIL